MLVIRFGNRSKIISTHGAAFRVTQQSQDSKLLSNSHSQLKNPLKLEQMQ